MSYTQKRLPSDNDVVLYIREGHKSRCFALAAHSSSIIKYKDKHGVEKRRPAQSSLYLSYHLEYAEALKKLDNLLEADKSKPLNLFGWKEKKMWRLFLKDKTLMIDDSGWKEGPFEFFQDLKKLLERAAEIFTKYPIIQKGWK